VASRLPWVTVKTTATQSFNDRKMLRPLKAARELGDWNMAGMAQYLTLGLAGETFGISIRNVREILDMRPISRLPHAPHFLLGVIDVRGSGYPIVDLRLKLDLPGVPATEATRIIILDVLIDDRVVGVGFVADCVYEVTDIDESSMEPVPSVGGRWQSDYIAGIGRKGDKFVIIFDLVRLMASAEMPARDEAVFGKSVAA
jgi:purine-binding chemotaxis protein CheW